MLKRGKDAEAINSGGQEIRMHTMGPKKSRSKRQFKEGVNMVKIFEKPPPSPEYQGTFQFYDDTLPLMLETLVTGEQWDEIMTKVNSIWRPIHEESVAIQTARSWLDYTMVGAYRRSKRQTELAKQVLDAAANISAYFKQVNRKGMGFRLYFKRTNVVNPKEEEEDFVYPIYHIEVCLRPDDHEDEMSAQSADNS